MDKKKILIVEDEVSLRRILADKFESEGMRVLTASDGEQGLEMALEERPDIILLDIIMPKKDGITMLRELRADERGKNIKTILLTNIGDADEMLANASKGVCSFLVKSNWDIKDISQKVKECLG